MKALMMDYPLTTSNILLRAGQLYAHKEIVTRLPDKSFHRYTYADFVRRSKKLAVALKNIGIKAGDRVATLSWNHYQHLECYFGIPAAGAVLHTLNLRLHPDDLKYIANHANDKVIIVDASLYPLLQKFRSETKIQHVIVINDGGKTPAGTLDYEKFLDAADEKKFNYRQQDENDAAAMCYTSGTTGRPKGVLYSHRSITLHSLMTALTDSMGLREADAILPVVPMFHANAWGLPYSATLVGAKQVFPGANLDPQSLLEDMAQEKVTFTGGVPTIWLGILEILDKNPKAYDLSKLRDILIGGSAAPKSLIQGLQERHNLKVVHAWGMTEMSPMGTVAELPSSLLNAPKEQQYDFRAKQGVPSALVELRARNEKGLVPWDGQSMGELEVRGPCVASAYYKAPGSEDRFTKDGWFRTGDIVSIDTHGCMQIQDRSKDLIKSGGEWISSVALENALMGHPKVAEAAVIAIQHPKWDERPLAVVVTKQGQQVSREELLKFLGASFAKWWLPDGVEFIDQIPRTAVGKFRKTALREQFKDYKFSDMT